MDAVTIAHLSDLHFGMKDVGVGKVRQLEVWRSLSSFLNDKIKPQLILITGDIVDTPDQQLYNLAQDELRKLRIEGSDQDKIYRVCAGNHDRHPWGNAPGRLRKIYEFLRPGTAVEAWFDYAFTGRIAHENVSEFKLSVGNNSWAVRVLGLDSSSDAKYSAQGYAKSERIQDIVNGAIAATGADLVIMMIHHHLLPIAELERNRPRFVDLFRPTIMLNAGTMLENLAKHNVNLVLHGHEHQRAVARYGTYHGQGNEIAVVGAGSSTGAKTLDGFDYARVSLNLLELRVDRSVYLREVRHDGRNWGITAEPEVLLLGNHAIRRARFYRRVSPSLTPRSRIVKYVEFQPNRDIAITETATDWIIEGGRWTKITQNSSGWPSTARVEFRWRIGTPTIFNDLQFVRDGSQDHTFRLEITLGGVPISQDRAAAESIISNWQWTAGAVLTSHDLDLLDPTKLGPYRSQNCEFAAVDASNELAALSLLVRIPPSVAPQPQDVSVHYEEPNGTTSPSPELTRTVQHHGPGTFSLEVPYPITGYRYVLAWPIAEAIGVSPAASTFQEHANSEDNARSLIDEFRAVCLASSFMRDTTLAIYTPSSEDPRVLIRRSSIILGDAHPEPAPAQVSLREGNWLYRHAWWGGLQQALSDAQGRGQSEVEAGFVLGEQALVIVPIRPSGSVLDPPWGLLRMGVHGHITEEELIQGRELFALGLSSMLLAARASHWS